eukprot:1160765-Pelagomonas_calceolata.AAC.7
MARLVERHVHLVEIKYCEDTRPGQQLVAKRQRADLCKNISGKAVTLHIILLGCSPLVHSLAGPVNLLGEALARLLVRGPNLNARSQTWPA